MGFFDLFKSKPEYKREPDSPSIKANGSVVITGATIAETLNPNILDALKKQANYNMDNYKSYLLGYNYYFETFADYWLQCVGELLRNFSTPYQPQIKKDLNKIHQIASEANEHGIVSPNIIRRYDNLLRGSQNPTQDLEALFLANERQTRIMTTFLNIIPDSKYNCFANTFFHGKAMSPEQKLSYLFDTIHIEAAEGIFKS